MQTRFLEFLERAHSAHLASKESGLQRLREELDHVRKQRDRLQKLLLPQEGEAVTDYVLNQLLNSLILVATGCLLVRRTKVSLAERVRRIEQGVRERPESTKRIEYLQMEIARLRTELESLQSNAHPTASHAA